jgi:hypothetical protein
MVIHFLLGEKTRKYKGSKKNSVLERKEVTNKVCGVYLNPFLLFAPL